MEASTATGPRRFGLAVVFLSFFAGVVGHFANTEFFASIVSPCIPLPLAAVSVSGVLEIAFALALVPPASRPWGIALIRWSTRRTDTRVVAGPAAA